MPISDRSDRIDVLSLEVVTTSSSCSTSETDAGLVYEKIMFSCGGSVINSFAMTYPTAERGLYDELVEAIEDTFTPGHESCDEQAARY